MRTFNKTCTQEGLLLKVITIYTLLILRKTELLKPVICTLCVYQQTVSESFRELLLHIVPCSTKKEPRVDGQEILRLRPPTFLWFESFGQLRLAHLSTKRPSNDLTKPRFCYRTPSCTWMKTVRSVHLVTFDGTSKAYSKSRSVLLNKQCIQLSVYTMTSVPRISSFQLRIEAVLNAKWGLQ